MALFTGTVECVSVNEGAGFTTLEDSTGDTETFILWFGTTIPPQVTSFTRVMHSMWLSLLREAQTNGLSVTVSHPTGSAEVTNVRVNS
ncbi:MAG: hypothetical protein O6951_06985 [Actinobacteria bacterium]|nr:hypothetical protein [Actinomycetota bacterium]